MTAWQGLVYVHKYEANIWFAISLQHNHPVSCIDSAGLFTQCFHGQIHVQHTRCMYKCSSAN